jgi:hypothetical protein
MRAGLLGNNGTKVIENVCCKTQDSQKIVWLEKVKWGTAVEITCLLNTTYHRWYM